MHRACVVCIHLSAFVFIFSLFVFHVGVCSLYFAFFVAFLLLPSSSFFLGPGPTSPNPSPGFVFLGFVVALRPPNGVLCFPNGVF